MAAYYVARRDAGPLVAVFAPILLSRYYLYGGFTAWWLASHGYWGGFFAMFSLALWRHPLAAAPLALLAAGIREFFLGLLVAGIAVSRDRRPWIAAGVVFLVHYAVHILGIRSASAEPAWNVSPWLFKGGWHFVWATLTFGWEELGARWVLAAAGLVGIVGVLGSGQRVQLASVSLLPLASFFVIGGAAPPIFAWGTTCVPFLLTAAPVSIARLRERRWGPTKRLPESQGDRAGP